MKSFESAIRLTGPARAASDPVMLVDCGCLLHKGRLPFPFDECSCSPFLFLLLSDGLPTWMERRAYISNRYNAEYAQRTEVVCEMGWSRGHAVKRWVCFWYIDTSCIHSSICRIHYVDSWSWTSLILYGSPVSFMFWRALAPRPFCHQTVLSLPTRVTSLHRGVKRFHVSPVQSWSRSILPLRASSHLGGTGHTSTYQWISTCIDHGLQVMVHNRNANSLTLWSPETHMCYQYHSSISVTTSQVSVLRHQRTGCLHACDFPRHISKYHLHQPSSTFCQRLCKINAHAQLSSDPRPVTNCKIAAK